LTDVHNVHNRVVVRQRRGTFAAIVLLILAAAAVIAFRGVGRWLVVEDPVDRADAIVVLSGGLPDRALEAVKVFRMGMAPQVWLTRPANPATELSKLGISFEGEEGYSRAILIHEGVPESAIRVLAPEIVNTEDEERTILAEMQSTGAARVIIVTSPPHTRRVRALWRRIAPAGRAVTVLSTSEDDYDADHWWRTTRDSLSVMREVMGLVNVWAGLPVRPASH
jgi:uncharacterized SAM-binding protein YcdF (DUF218 family)